ncbi:MAG: hemolysin family protein [Blautia sp.]|nr:hemolysin family protein [Lachnoclostridium sp.]MCM1212445.1 hemolysin family protein [Blautia sp.]
MDTTGVIQIVTLLILILLSAFFSSAETAFTTVNQVRLRTLAQEGSKRAVRVLSILDRYSKMLSTILIGNNIVNISASSVATTFAIRTWGNYMVGFMTGALTLVVLIFGEIIPKTWAMNSAEKISLLYGGIIQTLMTLLTPIIFIMDKLSLSILRLLHIDSGNRDMSISENELKTYVDVSHKGGAIESEERELIYNVFDFGDAVAKDIMVPRIHMTSIALSATYEEALSTFCASMFTRIPVYDDTPDNIIGIVNIKDFILVKDKEKFQIKKILRKAYYTYEYKKIADLMMEMREKSFNITFVLSEYGSTIGMITMEDLVEEIVGDIRDEYDADEEELIKETAPGQFLVEAGMKLDDINNALETDLDSEDFDSIGGLMIEQLERIPEDQETIHLENGIVLQAQGINKNRILKVLITIPEKETEEAEATGLEQ